MRSLTYAGFKQKVRDCTSCCLPHLYKIAVKDAKPHPAAKKLAEFIGTIAESKADLCCGLKYPGFTHLMYRKHLRRRLRRQAQ